VGGRRGVMSFWARLRGVEVYWDAGGQIWIFNGIKKEKREEERMVAQYRDTYDLFEVGSMILVRIT
jgi:hypothetical protein